jgi:hypothetical protein
MYISNFNKQIKVRNMKKILLLCCILLIVITACKKDTTPDTITYSEENYFDGFISNTGFGGSIVPKITGIDFELGTEFIPIVKGKITSINIKLPTSNNSLRVKIWDKLTTTLLRSEIVIVPTANTLTNIDIPDLALEKDKQYAITINTQDYFLRTKTSGTANVVYPVVIGNIKIMASVITNGSPSSTYPTLPFTDKFFGDVSFKFQQTN